MATSLEAITLDISNEKPIIELPCASGKYPYIYHYGSESNYQNLCHSYFIKNNRDNNETIIYKHIIIDVKYIPDKLYSSVDGMAGKCWVITINNNENETVEKYYIRNWIDIVEFYKEKGCVFIITEK